MRPSEVDLWRAWLTLNVILNDPGFQSNNVDYLEGQLASLEWVLGAEFSPGDRVTVRWSINQVSDSTQELCQCCSSIRPDDLVQVFNEDYPTGYETASGRIVERDRLGWVVRLDSPINADGQRMEEAIFHPVNIQKSPLRILSQKPF